MGCGCKNCDDITLLAGNDGRGISTIVDNGDNTFTIFLTDGTSQTITINPAIKISEYLQNIETIDISVTSATPSVYSFPNANYQTLQYTNTSGAAKTFLVTVSYDTLPDPSLSNTASIANWVDGAIIKTVGATDTIEYESLGITILSNSLYDGPNAGDAINIASVDPVETTAALPAETRFGNARLPRQISFFKKITLNNTETVSLKFKTKDAVTRAFITKAQLLVEEI